MDCTQVLCCLCLPLESRTVPILPVRLAGPPIWLLPQWVQETAGHCTPMWLALCGTWSSIHMDDLSLRGQALQLPTRYSKSRVCITTLGLPTRMSQTETHLTESNQCLFLSSLCWCTSSILVVSSSLYSSPQKPNSTFLCLGCKDP